MSWLDPTVIALAGDVALLGARVSVQDSSLGDEPNTLTIDISTFYYSTHFNLFIQPKEYRTNHYTYS